MRCSNCGHDNRIGANFCEECASPLERACRSCGKPLSPTAKFCPECAHPAGAPPTAKPRFAIPEAYTPKYLAEKIINSKAALEGERKQVTILFADLKSSMELLADRDPEDARRVLDAVVERMMEAVHAFEGTVSEVRGDGIMALFGAPLAHEDHAIRACYAALRMQEAVKRYADELRRSEGLFVQIRVGINSGEVVVRSIGSDLRMDYSAVGRATHMAARMEQLAAPGSTQLTADTLRLAEGFIQATSLGPVPIKGLVEPVEVFELVGAGASRTRLEAAARRGLTLFVGRNAELEQLREALDRTSLGRGQVVALVGEPGVGKSRLVREFTQSHDLQGWRVLKIASFAYGKVSAYLPMIDLLRDYFAIDARDAPRNVREKVTGKLLALGKSLRPDLPALLALLDAPFEDASWKALDPAQRRRRTLDSVRQLLLREAREQPLLLIFEDLHWIDGETQTLLDGLVESLPAARLLLLVTYRPEYRHAWGSRTYHRQLRIDPLPAESADELLDMLLGTNAALSWLKRLLIERTEANPFFLEESVKTLVETGALAGERGAYRLTRPEEQLKVPATVQAMLAARIDRLTPDAKWLLQAAAVIGRDVPMALLLAVADTPEQEVRADLSRLQTAEFLYEVRLFPDLQYTFKHALTHEVAYQGLLQGRQRALHARIAEAIERLSGERIAEHVERLAHHALRGELWEKAVHYLRLAGHRALARDANQEAVAYQEQALAALRHLPENRQTIELTIDIHIEIRNALFGLSEHTRGGSHLREAEALARTLGDERRLGRIASFLANHYVRTGDFNESIRLGQGALVIAQTLGDRSIEAISTYFLGITHVARGELNQAMTFFGRTMVLESDSRSERHGATLAHLSDVLSELGRFDEAIEHAEAAVRIAEAAEQAYALDRGLLRLGCAYFRKGDFPRAIQSLSSALDLGRTWQFVELAALVAASLGAARAIAGQDEEALPLIVSAVEEFRRRQFHNRPAFILLCAGVTYLAAKQIDEAASHAQEGLELTRRLGAHGNEAYALCLIGDIAATRRTSDAEDYYHQALALAEPRGMRPLVGQCHLGLGRLFRADKREQAQEHMAIAMTLFREMGMHFWLGQAASEMRELG